jgi:hypothetical protein
MSLHWVMSRWSRARLCCRTTVSGSRPETAVQRIFLIQEDLLLFSLIADSDQPQLIYCCSP